MGRFQLIRTPSKKTRQELGKTDKKAESVPLWFFTVIYVASMVAIILGIPTPTSHTEPVPVKSLPVVIPIMVVGYFFIFGLMKLLDYFRNRKQNRY